MQKITPNIWFTRNAVEAMEFYKGIFKDFQVLHTSYYPNSAEEGLADFQADFAGKELAIDFAIGDMQFTAINAGDEFRPNPSISFMVNFDPARDEGARAYLDEVWQKLIEGGKVLMPLDKYDFSEHYGWVEDKYGVNWQLILTSPEGEPRPFIMPALMFAGRALGKAKEARDYYLSIFSNTEYGSVALYPETNDMFTKDDVMFSDLKLENQWFVINDGGPQQDFTFTEGVSLMISCKDQEEIDYFWERLSTGYEYEQCGWARDKFGVSWQIIPENFEELMKRPGAYGTLLNQKKIVINEY